MEVLGFDLVYLLVTVGLAVVFTLAVLTIIGILLVRHFDKTGVALFPRLFMFILNLVETPIKNLLWLFNLDAKTLFLVRSNLINAIYRHRFAAVPVKERAIFLPQCLRNQKCPANTDEEGLHCKGCGKCEIADYKKEAEKLGYKFFIAPGGTMVKRMIKKYRPKAIIGVGCENEIQMGSEMAIRHGIIPMTIPLAKSGCVNTIVDWDEVRRITNLTPQNVND
ncbi:MAG: DUF116 domain-containing protein [Candidatus Diapherotrites archaeon]|nr:DUF116 domain-containing protein [Candidatus Diapherotrites archaeon]